MMSLEFLISMYLFLMSCLFMSLFYKHLLLLIISLEFILIMLIYNLYLMMMIFEVNSFLIMFMLIFMICEGALSLSLIVLMIRLYGNDYINSLSLMKW